MSKSVLEQYAELDWKRRKLQDELDQVKSQLRELEEDVLEEFSELGIDQVRALGLTVYPSEEIWAKPKRNEGEDLNAAHERLLNRLEELGYEGLGGPRVNYQSLTSLVRKFLRERGKLPEELEDVVELTETHKVKTRKA